MMTLSERKARGLFGAPALIPDEMRKEALKYFLEGNTISHIVYLMRYEINVGDVHCVILDELLRLKAGSVPE